MLVKCHQLEYFLKICLRDLGVNGSDFGTNSFCICAAIGAEAVDMSEQDVKHLGTPRFYVLPDILL